MEEASPPAYQPAVGENSQKSKESSFEKEKTISSALQFWKSPLSAAKKIQTRNTNPVPSPTDKKVPEYILEDLLSRNLIDIGDELVFLEESGFLTKDQWIDCQFTGEKYPSLTSWCNAVARGKKMSKSEIRKLNLMQLVQIEETPLAGYVEKLHADPVAESLSSDEEDGPEEGGDVQPAAKVPTPYPSQLDVFDEWLREENNQDSSPEEVESGESQDNRSIQALTDMASSMPNLISQTSSGTNPSPPVIDIKPIVPPPPPSTQNKTKKPKTIKELTSPKKTSSPKKSPKKKIVHRAEDSNKWIGKRKKDTPIQARLEFSQQPNSRDPVVSSPKKHKTQEENLGVGHGRDLLPEQSHSSDWCVFDAPKKDSFQRTITQEVEKTKTPEKVPSYVDLVEEQPLSQDSLHSQSATPVDLTLLAPMNPAPKPKFTLPVIVGTGLKSTMLECINVLVAKLGGKWVKDFSDEATHLVALPDENNNVKRTVKYSSAILKGMWIVSYEWIMECALKQRWVNEQPYEISGDSHAIGTPKKARLATKKLFEKKQFLLTGSFVLPSKQELESLIVLGGGQVLEQLPTFGREDLVAFRQSTKILCDPSISTDDARELFLKSGIHPINFNWLLDSISHFGLQDEAHYKVAMVSPDLSIESQNSLAF